MRSLLLTALFPLTLAFGGTGTNYCGPAELNSAGTSAEISAVGTSVVAENDLALAVSGMPAFKLGYFLMSQTQGSVLPAGSQGQLCLGGQITRLNQLVLNSGFSGSFALQLDLGALPGPTFQVSAGETWNFQAWYRDLNPANTSNFSDGLQITFS